SARGPACGRYGPMTTADEGDPAGTKVVRDWFQALDATPSWRESFARQPFAAPGAAALVAPLLTWDVLHRVLVAPPPVDVLTVKAGELVKVMAPRGRQDVERLFQSGVSTVVRA